VRREARVNPELGIRPSGLPFWNFVLAATGRKWLMGGAGGAFCLRRPGEDWVGQLTMDLACKPIRNIRLEVYRRSGTGSALRRRKQISSLKAPRDDKSEGV